MASKFFVFRLGDVEVREREFSLTKTGERLAVEPKAFRVLLILLRNPGKLISKEELLNAVWGETAVSDNSLTRSIALLRRLLGDDTRVPRYIETVATVGYRFVCKVDVSEDVSGHFAASGEVATNSLARIDKINGDEPKTMALKEGSRRRFRWMLTSGIVFAVGLAAAVWYLSRPRATLHISGSIRITLDGLNKGLGGTDGARLYFIQTSTNSIEEIGAKGGGIARVPVDLPGTLIWLLDISPDGSNALIGSSDSGNPINSLWNVRILGGAFKRLGEGDTGSFSNDGESVIYATHEGDIYTVRGDGTETHKLTGGLAAFRPRMSPDGKTIRFERGGLLWEMNSDGSKVHPLFQNWQIAGLQCCGRWSPDGSFYLFLIIGSPSAGVQMWTRNERRGLFPWSTAQPVQLTMGPIRWEPPIVGKDGRTIFASGRTLRGELSRFDSRTNQLLPFLGGISAEFVSFSKNDKSIAYVSYPDGLLFRANRDGSSPVQLTERPLYPVNPRWSPDGRDLLFAAQSSDGRMLMYIVPVEGGSPERVLPQDDQNEEDPKWSPDGQKIVFAGGNNRDATKEDLCVLDRTSVQVAVLPESTGLWSPRWSPDGRYIAALASGKPDLMIYSFETKRWSTLPVGSYVGFPEFSRDSKFVYFLTNGTDPGVFRIRVTGGEVERVVDLKDTHLTGLYRFSMSLDPSDAPLLLRDGGGDDIYALSLEQK